MNPNTLDLDELIRLAKRHFKTLVVFAAGGAALGYLVALVVPKKFKSIGKLSIQNNYFHNSALQDMGANVQDASEIQAQKRNLIDQALSNEFIDRLGEKNGVFKTSIEDPDRMVEREWFRKAIEILPLDASTYQIAVTAGSGQNAFQMTSDVIGQIIESFVSERSKRLNNYRESLLGQIESFKLAPAGGTAEVPTAGEDVARRVRALESRLRTLRAQFTNEHPAVLEAAEDLAILRKQLKGMGGSPAKAAAAPRGPRAELYDELMRKLKNLDIQLELEKNKEDLAYLSVARKPEIPVRPISPKRRNFFFGGLAFGILSALIWIGYRELKRMGEMTTEAFARELGVALLGELPVHDANTGEVSEPEGPRLTGREI